MTRKSERLKMKSLPKQVTRSPSLLFLKTLKNNDNAVLIVPFLSKTWYCYWWKNKTNKNKKHMHTPKKTENTHNFLIFSV